MNANHVPAHAADDIERHYSPESIGRRLDMKADSVRALVRRGELRAVKFGRAVRIPESAVRDFLGRAAR